MFAAAIFVSYSHSLFLPLSLSPSDNRPAQSLNQSVAAAIQKGAGNRVLFVREGKQTKMPKEKKYINVYMY